DPARAKEMTFEFSEYLRSNMESLTEEGLIHFKQELKHIEAYLNLEKAIYGKGLNVVYNIEVSDFKLPVLTLQPIVENAVKHGIGRREGGGTVTVSAIETDSTYVLTVTDDGLGFKKTENKHKSVGITNVTNRLSAMCGGSLTIESDPGAGSAVTITIPK
ncbi:MAG: ATP-binding protein, partial [Treponema sp.]|nr:ATP-binding protein [Treponema sp.]